MPTAIQTNVQTGERTELEIDPSEIPPPQPPQPPTSITPRQARLALLGAGLLDTVQSAFAELPEPNKTSAQIEWEYSVSIDRASPLVSQFAPMLGMNEAQIDELFIAAAAL